MRKMRKSPGRDVITTLRHVGITHADAMALRTISKKLHKWHEYECGVDWGGVERDEITGECTWYNSRTGTRAPYPDLETPQLKRLAKIMANYPDLKSYIQGDPRGCALYILRPGDVPEGEDPSAYYSRGLPVY